MQLKPGLEKEYEKRHAELWPELRKQISNCGVKNHSIFWDKDTNILFGYQEVEGDSNSQAAEDNAHWRYNNYKRLAQQNWGVDPELDKNERILRQS